MRESPKRLNGETIHLAVQADDRPDRDRCRVLALSARSAQSRPGNTSAVL
jgi:hypothetical protein